MAVIDLVTDSVLMKARPVIDSVLPASSAHATLRWKILNI